MPLVLAHVLTAIVAMQATAALAREEERSHARTALDAALPLAAASVAGPLRTGDQATAQDTLAALSDRAGIRLLLHGPEVAAPPTSVDAPPAAGLLPEVRAALRTGRGEAVRDAASSGERALNVAVRVEDADGVLGVVRGQIELAGIADVPARRAGRTLLLALAALLLAALLTLSHVSRQVDARIDRLADAARRFAAGDLGHRVDPYESRELGGLAMGLNEMALQLEQRVEQLAARAAEQRAMLQSMSAGMVALDEEQRILRSNARADTLLGIDPELRIRGRMLQEVTRNRVLNELLAAAAESDDPVEGDVEVGERIVSVSIEPLIDVERGRLGLLMLLADITTLRRLERLRSEFAANVSHELRTPITNIKGYAETLLETDEPLPEITRRFIGVIARNAGRLEAIVEDLLALAGLERQAEGESFEMAGAAAARIVATVVDQFEQAAIDREIQIDTEVERGLQVVGGIQLIEQSLSNLLSNAIRYCPPGTPVTVGARGLDEETLELFVADRGPGIAAEHLPRIFERFYRVDQARSRDLGGTGLGLAIVKHVAMAHGGRAEVQSQPGSGSRFSLVLPRRSRVSRMSPGKPGTSRPRAGEAAD